MGYGLAFQLFYMEGSVPGRWSMSFLHLALVWLSLSSLHDMGPFHSVVTRAFGR